MEQAETNILALAAKRHLKIDEVVALVGLSRATIYRRIDSGDFPKPIHLSARRRAWVKREIEDWMDALEEAPRE